MSGLEREELLTRMNGTTDEEKQLIAQTLSENVLWNELFRRSMDKDKKIKKAEAIFKENSPADYQSKQDYK